MQSINAYLIQEKIRQKGYVTVPWIQLEYGLDYKGAKEFLSYLKNRDWIESVPTGIKYPVIENNLQLRSIVRDEVEGLIEDITPDCISALTCIQARSVRGASFGEIESDVRGEDDTITALEILETHKLIYSVDDMYFTTISKETIRVLSDVVDEKRKHIANLRMHGKSDDNIQLDKLFNVLFQD